MRAYINNHVLYIQAEDVPRYKKRGSVVRNSYFWALRSIAARSPFDKPWEFESEVWFALNRMLISFFESGYLGTRETQLEFLDGTEVPQELRGASTWVATFASDEDQFEADEINEDDDDPAESLPREVPSSQPSRSALTSTETDEPQLDGQQTDQQPSDGKQAGPHPARPRRSTRLG